MKRIALVLILAGVASLLVAAPASGGDCGPVLGQGVYGAECAVQNGLPQGPPQGAYSIWAGPVKPNGLNPGGPTGVFYCDDGDFFIPFLNPNGSLLPKCYEFSPPSVAARFIEFRPTGETDPKTGALTTVPYVITCMWGRPLWSYTVLISKGSGKGKLTGSIMGWCTAPISTIDVTLRLEREGVTELVAQDWDPLDAYGESGGSCAECYGFWKADASWIFLGHPNGFWIDVVAPCYYMSYWKVACSQTENFTRGSGGAGE